MKFLLLFFFLSIGVEAFAVEAVTECPMMREANRRENLKSAKIIDLKKLSQKSRTSAQ